MTFVNFFLRKLFIKNNFLIRIRNIAEVFGQIKSERMKEFPCTVDLQIFSPIGAFGKFRSDAGYYSSGKDLQHNITL